MPCKYVRDRKVYVTGVGLVAAKGQFGKISCEDSQKSIRVMRRSDGWYAQVVVETSVKQLPDTVTSVGIDVGLEHFATLSDGELIENPRFLRKHEKKLKTAQRQLSRKQKGSNRRDKTRKRVAKLHEKVARKRRGFLHRVSTQIVRSYGRIAVEKLTIRNMVKNRRLAKSISDAGWYTFRQMLAYKAESAGREYVEVNPAGTSQECPDCGEIRKKDLSERIHNCSCGCQMSRDLAAAVVIEKRAFRRAAQSCGKTSSDVSQDRQRRRSAKTRCCDLSQRIVTIKG
jgi:putative transposase